VGVGVGEIPRGTGTPGERVESREREHVHVHAIV
jgi:hypothetical protein